MIGLWTRFVAVGFWKGARLARSYPLLEGSAPTSRVVKIRSLEEARTSAFRALLRATRLDETEPVHAGTRTRISDRAGSATGQRARTRNSARRPARRIRPPSSKRP